MKYIISSNDIYKRKLYKHEQNPWYSFFSDHDIRSHQTYFKHVFSLKEAKLALLFCKTRFRRTFKFTIIPYDN